jgi:hypothetical protein
MSATLGEITPDFIGQYLDTGYDRFQSPFGINGLCRVDGKSLNLLAVVSTRPNTGQFHRFMDAAKQEFDEIGIWEILNRDLHPVLERYGFIPAKMIDLESGETMTGQKWTKPKTGDEP